VWFCVVYVVAGDSPAEVNTTDSGSLRSHTKIKFKSRGRVARDHLVLFDPP
jgi:hypothetical protein